MLDKIKTWLMSLNNIQKVAVLVIVALLIAYFPYFAGGWDTTGSFWDGDLKNLMNDKYIPKIIFLG